ncbi:MAG: Y-family DNA polymerase [Methylobacter sp.]
MTAIALIDCNNFYANCEAVFNPKLKGKAVVILSNNDGCCVSRSDAAKRLGIKMGAPWFQIKDQFKPGEVIALSSNYALYADASNRVMNILSQFSVDQEIYSCDESFISMSGFGNKDLTDYGKDIKATVLQWTGVPVCVGIGATKTLAKLANHCAKKRPDYSGVCNFNAIPMNVLDPILASIPVGEVWGIGSRLLAKLNQCGILTVLDLKQAHSRTLRDKFSVVMAKIIAELNGVSCIDLEQVAPPKQNIASTRSFGIPVTSIDSLIESVTLYTSRAAEKARAQHTHANSISVFIQTSPFAQLPYYGGSLTVALPSPSNDTRLLVKTALWIVKRLYKPGYVYQKAGVLLNDLVPDEGRQRDLFFDASESKYAQSAKVMAVLDSINQRYGRQTLKLGSEGFKAPWKMKQNFKSPGYTTNWNELIQAS